MGSSAVVLSSANLIYIFAKFKIVPHATNVKELNVLKPCYNPLNVSHSIHSKKNMRLDVTKRFLVFKKNTESVINIGKVLEIFLKILEKKQLSLQA
jgi:hypothetical protein